TRKPTAARPGRPPTFQPAALFQAPAGRIPPLAGGAFGLLPPTAVAHRTALAREVGGWRRPSATESAVPQVDLWTRMISHAGPPLLVPHITNIKIASAVRRD